jgi:uncharacterized protein
MRVFVPDINVWLAMAFEAHSHHPAAKSWFESAGENSCFFCRYTQSGFLRLATNPAVFGADTLTNANAWTCYDALIGDFRVGFIGEPLGLGHLWRRFTMSETYSPKIWNDAFLAAYALAGGMNVVTFDKSFIGYEGLTSIILE